MEGWKVDQALWSDVKKGRKLALSVAGRAVNRDLGDYLAKGGEL